MSRKNRFFKATQSIPSDQQPQPMRDFASLNTVRVGTTNEPIPLVAESPMVSVASSQFETVQDTSKSEIPSAKKSKYSVTKADLVTLDIRGTQCCGMHTVSGFQHEHWSNIPKLLHCIDHTFTKQKEHRRTMTHANRTDTERWQGSPELQALYPEFIPNRNPQNLNFMAENIAAMMVFTWNSDAWLPDAKRISEFVKTHGLGECTITPKIVNSNSGREIASMIWNVNKTAYHQFLADNPVE